MGRLLPLLALVVLLVPSAAAGSADHQILFSERVSRFSGSGDMAEGETRGFRFVVAEPNLTRIEFVLTWREEGDRTGFSKPDKFTLAVTSPDRLRLTPATSATGEARVVAPELNEMPADEHVAEEDVATRLADLTSYRGTGEWQVQVRLEDVGNPQGAQVDTGNSFELMVLVHHYEGVAMRVVSLAPSTGFAADLSSSPDFGWALAAGGLGVAATILGVVLGVRTWRARAERVSPGGGNMSSPKR